MIRNHRMLTLALLIVGLTALRWVAPLPSTAPAPTITIIVPSSAGGTPVPAVLRGFDDGVLLDLDLLDQRAEVLFDL